MASFQPARPSSGTSTGRVWDIADALTRETGRRARRADVIKRFQDEGGNYNTASTQYHYWKASYDAANERSDAAIDSIGPVAIQIKEAGRIVVPAELRAALNVKEGDFLTARIIDGEIRLMPLETAVRKARKLVRKFVPQGMSLVDELIAERRDEDK